MRILWVKTDFLHPTNRGGQIRTLEMLRQLHRLHEVHFVAFDDPSNPEGLERSREYCSVAHPIPYQPVPKQSIRFAGQLLKGLVSPIPVAAIRWRSNAMRRKIGDLVSHHSFDARVCDFLFPAANIADITGWVLFQHNVETIIWERHAQTGRTAVHRAYFKLQARRMFEWERRVCREASHIVAVSELDERTMRERFGVEQTSHVPTGVDLSYFERRASGPRNHDLVFVGSMDWMPNTDAVHWFLDEVLPLIREKRPECRLAIVGRNPPISILAASRDPLVTVTGTVPDVRPFFWESAVSIVPLRIGGGTRLKIFEAMAAGTSVVSTTIGAEGLPVQHGRTIRIADSAQDFAAQCLDLLEKPKSSETLAAAALEMIRAKFSWEQVTRRFEEVLLEARASLPKTA